MSEQVFSEAAREAAARKLFETYSQGPEPGPYYADELEPFYGDAEAVLAAAVDADPRAKACLKLAALSDEDLVERVADAVQWHENHAREQGYGDMARTVLRRALGLPVAEQETTTGGRDGCAT